jgi:hypothetical protein
MFGGKACTEPPTGHSRNFKKALAALGGRRLLRLAKAELFQVLPHERLRKTSAPAVHEDQRRKQSE